MKGVIVVNKASQQGKSEDIAGNVSGEIPWDDERALYEAALLVVVDRTGVKEAWARNAYPFERWLAEGSVIAALVDEPVRFRSIHHRARNVGRDLEINLDDIAKAKQMLVDQDARRERLAGLVSGPQATLTSLPWYRQHERKRRPR